MSSTAQQGLPAYFCLFTPSVSSLPQNGHNSSGLHIIIQDKERRKRYNGIICPILSGKQILSLKFPQKVTCLNLLWVFWGERRVGVCVCFLHLSFLPSWHWLPPNAGLSTQRSDWPIKARSYSWGWGQSHPECEVCSCIGQRDNGWEWWGSNIISTKSYPWIPP